MFKIRTGDHIVYPCTVCWRDSRPIERCCHGIPGCDSCGLSALSREVTPTQRSSGRRVRRMHNRPEIGPLLSEPTTDKRPGRDTEHFVSTSCEALLYASEVSSFYFDLSTRGSAGQHFSCLAGYRCCIHKDEVRDNLYCKCWTRFLFLIKTANNLKLLTRVLFLACVAGLKIFNEKDMLMCLFSIHFWVAHVKFSIL